MILDTLTHISKYTCLNKGLDKAFAFLQGKELHTLADGRYPIDGEQVFALVSSYQTKAPAEAKFESHKKYIDVQYLLSGEERMGYAPLGAPEVSVPYDAEKDVALYSGEKQYFHVKPGMAAVFFPQDVHQPGVAAGEPSAVRKIVVKVRVAP